MAYYIHSLRSFFCLQAKTYGIGLKIDVKQTSSYLVTQKIARGVPCPWYLVPGTRNLILTYHTLTLGGNLLKSPLWQNGHVKTEMIKE
jgi:hypothetical protein